MMIHLTYFSFQGQFSDNPVRKNFLSIRYCIWQDRTENNKKRVLETWSVSVHVIQSHNHYLFTQLSPQVTTHWRREQEGGSAGTLWVIIVPILKCRYFNPLISFKSLIETHNSVQKTQVILSSSIYRSTLPIICCQGLPGVHRCAVGQNNICFNLCLAYNGKTHIIHVNMI